MSVASGDFKGSEGSSEKKKPYGKSEGSNGSYEGNGSREGGYQRRDGGRGGDGFREGKDNQDRVPTAAMEVTVDNNIERAMKVLKRKLIKEGLFKELKSRKYYEKPSERKKRKKKESVKKVRKEELRARKNALLIS